MNDWKNLLAVATIQNNFVFGRTMELYPELCRRLLELILNVNISKISFPEREKTIETRIDGKGIRLDVYVEDADRERYFDVEMQVADSANLGKRMRYYQSLIDTDKLKRGQHYSELGESYIIFICPFDHFKKGRRIYTFRERCDQDMTLALADGATKIFLNTKGSCGEVPPELEDFLSYVERGVVSGKFVEELDAAVKSIKTNEKVGHDFMTFQMALIEERMKGEERGRTKGIELGRNAERESVAEKMLRKGKSFEEIAEFIDLPIQRLKELAQDVLPKKK